MTKLHLFQRILSANTSGLFLCIGAACFTVFDYIDSTTHSNGSPLHEPSILLSLGYFSIFIGAAIGGFLFVKTLLELRSH